jgi:hypothetical protein
MDEMGFYLRALADMTSSAQQTRDDIITKKKALAEQAPELRAELERQLDKELNEAEESVAHPQKVRERILNVSKRLGLW